MSFLTYDAKLFDRALVDERKPGKGGGTGEANYVGRKAEERPLPKSLTCAWCKTNAETIGEMLDHYEASGCALAIDRFLRRLRSKKDASEAA
jgi:hypothetical protein